MWGGFTTKHGTVGCSTGGWKHWERPCPSTSRDFRIGMTPSSSGPRRTWAERSMGPVGHFGRPRPKLGVNGRRNCASRSRGRAHRSGRQPDARVHLWCGRANRKTGGPTGMCWLEKTTTDGGKSGCKRSVGWLPKFGVFHLTKKGRIGEVHASVETRALKIRLAFKRPIFLPAS